MENNKNIIEISKKIEGDAWQKAMDEAFKTSSKKAKIDGFRPGKAPKDVFIKKYGKEALFFDAADLCLDAAYHEVLKENEKLEIATQPSVNVKSIDETGVEFVFTLTLYPEVKLNKYKKLGVKKETTTVSKEEIEKALKETLNRYAEVVKKNGAIENGDTAVIDFEGFKEGIPFEGGKGENYSLEIGSNTFIPGFEEQLIGLKLNDEKDIEVTFPEEYHSEDLKGQKAIFKIKINEVKTTEIPELNKEFFEDLGMEGIDTKEALEKQLEENIKARKESNVENNFIDKLLDEGIKNMEVEIPDVMIKEEQDRMIRQYEENLKMQGITLQQFYQFTNSDETALKDQMKPEAERRISSRLLLEAIVKEEKITITEEKTKEEAANLAKKYNMEEDKFLNEFGGLEMVKYDLEMRQAIDLLKDNN
ncbi:MAG: trigger factor [Bacilli bacterium]